MKKISLLFTLILCACQNSNTISQNDDNEKKLKDINGELVFFDFDSSMITKESHEKLLDQAYFMKQYPEISIRLEGHCDERGSTEYNLALGANRANAAKQVIVENGINSERVKTISFGKEKPQFIGSGEAIWSKNRNTTTRVILEK